MFQFRRFPSYTYLIQCMIHEYCPCVFPHSDISGSSLICSSPKLFAACHVLHRLLMPRHSPCALISLTYLVLELTSSHFSSNYAGSTEFFTQNCIYPNFLIKVSTICFCYIILFNDVPLLPCFFILLSVQFSRCSFGYIFMYPQN